MENFAIELKRLRKQEKLTIVELSKLIGYSKSIISCWENNEKEPTLPALIKISEYFGLTLDELVGTDNTSAYGKLSTEEREILALYSNLDYMGKKLVRQTLETLNGSVSGTLQKKKNS